MKRFILMLMAALLLTTAITTTVFAEGEDDCQCGADEDGICLPCEE
jgi:hypothetical protein